MLPCWGRGLVPRPKSMETQKKNTEPKLRCINICSKTMIVMLIHITSFWNTLIWMILHYIPPNDINLLIWCNSAQTTAKQHLSTSFNIHNDIQYVVWLSVFLIVFFIIYKHFHGFWLLVSICSCWLATLPGIMTSISVDMHKRHKWSQSDPN